MRKWQCLSKFPKGYPHKIRLGGIFNDHKGRSGVEIALRGTESNNEQAEVLAEAVVYLGERGLLPLKNEPIPALPIRPKNLTRQMKNQLKILNKKFYFVGCV